MLSIGSDWILPPVAVGVTKVKGMVKGKSH